MPSLRPSKNLPEFLRLDLTAPKGSHSPILEALDQVGEEATHSALESLVSLWPQNLASHFCRKVLEGYGYRVASLSEEEQRSFFEQLPEILSAGQTLRAISKVADLYFPGCTLKQGRDHQRKGPLFLADNEEFAQITLRISKKVPSPRIHDFSQSVKEIIPKGVDLNISFEKEPTESKKPGLPIQFSLTERRL